MRVLLLHLVAGSVAAIGFLVAGCSSSKKDDPGPGCPQVVDHMLVVMKQGLTGHDSVALGDRGQMIAQCEARKMSAADRRCLLAAKDLSGLASCKPSKAPASPPADTRMPSQTADPVPPAPVPTRPLPTGSAAGSATPGH